MEHIIHEVGLHPDDCFHYSVQSGAEMDLVTTVGGQVFGSEFKHGDVPQITKSMREAAEDLNLRRVFEVHPGSDTFPLDEAGRFFAVAWKDLPNLRSRMV